MSLVDWLAYNIEVQGITWGIVDVEDIDCCVAAKTEEHFTGMNLLVWFSYAIGISFRKGGNDVLGECLAAETDEYCTGMFVVV